MIHVKRTRLNTSYFPDDYDDDKLVQSYEDSFLYIEMPVHELPDFFVDLVKKYPNEMSKAADSYFSYTFPSGPIDPTYLRTEIHGNRFSFRYWIKKDAKESNEELEAVVEQCLWEWINHYTTDSTRYRVAYYLADKICKFGKQVTKGDYSPYEFEEFIDKIASALGTNPNRFRQLVFGSSDLASVDFTNTDIGFSVFDTLYHEYTDSNTLIIACINTAQYTGFKPQNI